MVFAADHRVTSMRLPFSSNDVAAEVFETFLDPVIVHGEASCFVEVDDVSFVVSSDLPLRLLRFEVPIECPLISDGGRGRVDAV